MAEGEEELKSFLFKGKEESEKAGLKLNIQETKIMPSSPITLWLCAATKTQCSQNNNNNFLKRNKGKKKNQITCQQIMKAQQKIMIQNLSGNNTK